MPGSFRDGGRARQPTRGRRLRAGILSATLVTLLAAGTVGSPARRTAAIEDHGRRLAAGAAPGWQLPVHVASPAELVGFRWAGATEGAVEMRVRHQGQWSSWLRVEGNPSEGPDRTSPEFRGRTAAGPVWVGSDVHDLEVRVVEGRLSRLELHALHTKSPTRSVGGIAAASAEPSQPAIITRGQWGADEGWRNSYSYCSGEPSYAPGVRYAVVHHTDNVNDYGPNQAAALIQGMYYFHTHVNGWCDIGYNFLVDRFGRVYEGRYGGMDKAVVGAHAGGFNTGSTGVALIGTFMNDRVPADMYGGLRDVVAWKLALHGVNPTAQITTTAGGFSGSQWPAGATVRLWTITGHRDLDQTDCPGDLAYADLVRLRVDVQRAIAASGVHGADSGYHLVASDGGVFAFGTAGYYGSTGAIHLNRPIVGMAETPSARGYWMVASDGGIFAFGDALFLGSTASTPLTAPIVGMARSPTGLGYWLVASDGGIFAFGDARFYGSTGAIHLNQPIVGMAATNDGRGYWLVARDGGIFAFGDAGFYGSTGATKLNQPIVAMAATASSQGYWFSAADGGVFTFGDAGFSGSAGGVTLDAPVVAITPWPGGNGYRLSSAAGVLYGFGPVPFYGSTAHLSLARPIVAMAAVPGAVPGPSVPPPRLPGPPPVAGG